MNNLLTVCKRCHAELHGLTTRFVKPTISLIKELREQFHTYQEIGDHLGISRQRVHQIIKEAEKIGVKINRENMLKDGSIAQKIRFRACKKT